MQKQPLGNKADRSKNLEHGLQLFGMPARCVAFFFALSSPDHASCMRCPVSMKANPIRGSCTSFLAASDLDDDGCPDIELSAGRLRCQEPFLDVIDMLEDHSACPCSIGSTSLSPYDSAGDLDSLFRSLTMAEVPHQS
jgi:hypothetical protein